MNLTNVSLVHPHTVAHTASTKTDAAIPQCFFCIPFCLLLSILEIEIHTVLLCFPY